VVGLCPSTEANLGDGFFELASFQAQGGRFGVGSDSNVQGNLARELRLLEECARLRRGARCVLATEAAPTRGSVGESLWLAATAGGRQALGLSPEGGGLAPGGPADFVVLDGDHPRLAGHGPDSALDAYLLGGGEGAVKDVISGGRQVVREGAHLRREALYLAFKQALAQCWRA